MHSTASGATVEKESNLLFISDAHEKFYYEKLKEVRNGAHCVNKCGMNVSRILGVALSDEQVETLLSGKKILLKALTSKLGKKYDAYIIPTGIEDYSYMKDGEKKSGKQFKFAMDFSKKGKYYNAGRSVMLWQQKQLICTQE